MHALWTMVAVVSAAVVAASPSAHLARDPVAAVADAGAARLLIVRDSSATNLQVFGGTLGGEASPITQSNDATRQYLVAGDTFTDYTTASTRACDNQHNSCADAANAGSDASLTVKKCDSQNIDCKSAAASATVTAFVSLSSSDANFDYFCNE